MSRPRLRRIRFVGGQAEGYRVMREPLELRVLMPVLDLNCGEGAEPPAVFVSRDQAYRLAILVDDTGIEFKAYLAEGWQAE